jgi:hypothetical protein
MSQVRAIASDVMPFNYAMNHESHAGAAKAANGATEQVFLLLDARGLVKFCSDPRALRTQEGELLGKSITGFLDGLPLRATTPGYNVAYVRFTYAEDCRRRMTLKLPSGATRPVDVGVRPIFVDRGYCLLVQLRLVREPEGVAVEPVPLRRAATVETAEVCF